jgi:hypothetical protein
MANSTQVIAIDAASPPIVAKSIYRGNVQCIPVNIDSQSAQSAGVTKVLPSPCWVVAAYLIPSTGDVDIGYTGALTAVATGASSVCEAYSAVDVSGKTLLATTDGTASVSGYIMIVTDE